MKKRLLITGFDPFCGGNINPSWIAVEQLPDTVGDFALCKLQIPTVFGKGAAMVREAAERFQPDVILCVGVADGRNAVTPEQGSPSMPLEHIVAALTAAIAVC